MTHAQNHLYPLTSPQREIWFDQILHPSLPLYNVGGYLQIDGAVDPKLFEQAVNLLVQRHDALRTVLVPTSDMQMQTFLENCPVTVPFHDFSGDNDPRQAALAWMQEQFVQPFDLYDKPLCRFALLKIAENCFFGFNEYHHLIVDGWSISLLNQSFTTIYTQLSQSQQIEPVAPSYLAFVKNDRVYIESDRYEVHRQYWLEKYRTLPEPLFEPRYLSQFIDQIPPSERKVLWLPRSFYNRLRAYAKNTQSTLFHVMLGALYVYFTRTQQREELAIGLPVLNRSNAAFKETVGLFIGVSAAWFQFGTQLSFGQLLKAIGKALNSDYRRQRLPISELNRAVGIHKIGRRQLFDLQLNYAKQNHDMEFGAFKAKSLILTNNNEQTPLSISVWEFHENENVQVDFVYNLAYFDDAEIERIQSRFMLILEYVLTHVDESIRTIPLLTEAEQQQLLAWNDTAVDYPHDKTIVNLFEEQVAKTPAAIAVVFEDQQLTYQELNTKANKLANYLLNLKSDTDNWLLITDNCLVGICIERSFEMVIGLLGILKAGGAYLPLDPAYPAARLAFMLDDAQVPVLLTQSSLTEGLPETKAQVVCLDADAETLSQKSSENVESGVGPENLAYVIYTSGSTGNPKGVQIGHLSLLNFLTSIQKQPGLTSSDVLLAVTTLSFDIAALEFYLPLIVGAKIVLASRIEATDGLQLIKKLDHDGITIMQATPATWHLLLTSGWQSSPQLKILCGGEALPGDLATQLLEKGQSLWNLYGPTETTIWSSIAQVSATTDTSNTVSIGRPIANTQIYILDHHQKFVPVGIAGELYIGGAGVARGYLNRPELTDEKFIKNPLSSDPNSRLYKTGDLACYLPDGNIEYLGRIDNQVKIDGFRIELSEIEAVLTQHPLVRQAVVIVWEVHAGDKRIVAYLSLNQKSAATLATSDELHHFLQERLPDYMIPVAFIPLPKIPLTPNGKIDRRRLPTPDPFQIKKKERFIAPRTPFEKTLAEIWAEVLEHESIGIYDNFFELGGHSLLATQVMSRICDTCCVELSLRDLFESPTIAGLNEQIQVARQQCLQSSLPKITPVNRSKPLQLSFAQQRLWFLNQLEGESAIYNMPAALHIEGPLQQNALLQSLKALVERHESLRTVFPTVNGTPVVKLSEVSDQLSVINLQNLPQSEIEVEVHRLINEDAQRPFDLEKGPLFRATLLHTVRNDSHVLLINMHHIISDGWSLNVLIREFSTLYEAFLQNKPSPLPSLPIQYVDFAHWQREWLKEEILEKQLNYWIEQLAGIPALLELPTDHPRPPVQGFQGARLPISLSPELTTQLKQLTQQTGTTLFMTLWSAFATLLSRYSGQSDIVIGSPIANRTQSVTESLIGFFVNTLVLRLDLAGNPPFEDILLKARRVALEAYSHQELPFEQLVDALQPVRSLSHSPLFQVMFVLQNAPIADLELAGLSLTVLELENVIAKFDLTFELTETASGLFGTLEYNTDLFEHATIERLSWHLQTLLTGIVANPKMPIHELPLLTKAEQQQLLAWNDTATDYPHDKTIIDLFEEQVDKTPDAIAVVFEEQQLTYRKLNQKSNQLAHYLLNLKSDTDNCLLITDNCLVGICVERSLEMVIGLLGILKAGGAYLPLDPDYPSERLQFMVEDSDIKVLLSQTYLLNRLLVPTVKVVDLESNWEQIATHSGENPVRQSGPHNLAYVIYTSGSTGVAKGVMIEHAALSNFIHSAIKTYPISQADRVLQFASINFDATIEEIYPILTQGGRLILRDKGMLDTDQTFLQTCQHKGVTILDLPTAYWQQLITNPDSQKYWPQSVRLVIIGGEAASMPHVKHWQQTLGQNVPLLNTYGPTEATVVASSYRLTESTAHFPIGKPLANIKIYILDAYHNPTPLGVPGELCIAGKGLARGYLNRPEFSQEKFIEVELFGQTERIYQTGDLARYLPDGNLEYLGRIDNQVKMRGFRIELGEIEEILAQYADIQENAVVVSKSESGDKRLVAYMTAKPGHVIYKTELRAFLQERLPNYMIPNIFVSLEAMPLTPSGKIDKRALSQLPVTGHQLASKTYLAPRDTLELQLIAIWEEILNISPIGVRDNFFELGGHSLLAVRLMANIQQQLGKHLPLATLFQSPTVEGLASIFRQQTDSQTWEPLVAIQPNGSKPPFFCLPGAGGNVIYLFELARHLGQEQPFYGLQAVGLDGESAPDTRIEDMAARYIREIQTIQPQGPYLLGGHSFGSGVAFEMSQQLQQQGQEVALLAIFDTAAPEPFEQTLDLDWDEAHWITDIAHILEQMLGIKLAVSYEALQTLEPQAQFSYLYDQLQQSGWLPVSADIKQLRGIVEVFKTNCQIYYAPSATIYPIPISLFKAKEMPTVSELETKIISLTQQLRQETTWGWHKYANDAVDILMVPGDHFTMMNQPHVQLLAEQLKICIEQAL